MIDRIRYLIWRRTAKIPSNERLNKLFENIDKIVIKEDGAVNNKALGKKILLTITQKDKIDKFQELLELQKENPDGMCMCLGDYAIELKSGLKKKAVFGLHHGFAIRYHKWDRDAHLERNYKLLEFLSDEGLKKPLEEFRKEMEESAKSQKEFENWLNRTPKSISKYLDQWYSIEYTYEERYENIKKDLFKEIPEK